MELALRDPHIFFVGDSFFALLGNFPFSIAAVEDLPGKRCDRYREIYTSFLTRVSSDFGADSCWDI